MKEIWKDIKNYEGLYQVSNLGNIKSHGRIIKYKNGKIVQIKDRILKVSLDKDGYVQVGLHKNNISKTFKVHRLVAQAFIPNTNNFPQINHINEIKNDNRVENLEWCDCKYNNNYGSHILNQSNKISMPIKQLSLNGKVLAYFKSATDCARKLGYEVASINRCCLGKQHTAYGYKWEKV